MDDCQFSLGTVSSCSAISFDPMKAKTVDINPLGYQSILFSFCRNASCPHFFKSVFEGASSNTGWRLSPCLLTGIISSGRYLMVFSQNVT